MNGRLMKRTLLATAVVALAAAFAAVSSQSAPSAAAGKNGRIVFNDQSGALMLVNPDGTGVVRLAGTFVADEWVGASFSPDGAWIAYTRGSYTDPDVFVIRPDGSSQRQGLAQTGCTAIVGTFGVGQQFTGSLGAAVVWLDCASIALSAASTPSGRRTRNTSPVTAASMLKPLTEMQRSVPWLVGGT